jgi:hypothetical protein
LVYINHGQAMFDFMLGTPLITTLSANPAKKNQLNTAFISNIVPHLFVSPSQLAFGLFCNHTCRKITPSEQAIQTGAGRLKSRAGWV